MTTFPESNAASPHLRGRRNRIAVGAAIAVGLLVILAVIYLGKRRDLIVVNHSSKPIDVVVDDGAWRRVDARTLVRFKAEVGPFLPSVTIRETDSGKVHKIGMDNQGTEVRSWADAFIIEYPKLSEATIDPYE